MITSNGKYIHFAITREAQDGPYVVAITHDPRVVQTLMSDWYRNEWLPDVEAYNAADDATQAAWVPAPRQRVHAFEAGQNVRLGFPFDAAKFDGHFAQVVVGYDDDRKEKMGDSQGADAVRDILRRQAEMDW
jgi:hypothetical protein